MKAQHEGALPPLCIIRKDPRVPHPEEPPEGPVLATEQSALTAENTWSAEVPALPPEESVSLPEPPVSQSEIVEPLAVTAHYSVSASEPSVLASEADVTVPEPQLEPESSVMSTPVESAAGAEEHEIVAERPVTYMVSETPTSSAEPTVLTSEPSVMSETAETYDPMRASGQTASEVSVSLREPAVPVAEPSQSTVDLPAVAVPEHPAGIVSETSTVAVPEPQAAAVLDCLQVLVSQKVLGT